MKTPYLCPKKITNWNTFDLLACTLHFCVLKTFLQELLYSWGQIDSQIEFGGNMQWERMSQREIKEGNKRISKLEVSQK